MQRTPRPANKAQALLPLGISPPPHALRAPLPAALDHRGAQRCVLHREGRQRRRSAISFISRRNPGGARRMSASLIGHSGSSAFRLSTATASMSLTGSCFSSESAPGPFHHGVRRRGGTIFEAALPSDERQVQADMRTHLIHRPARDIIPPQGGARVSSYRM